MAACHYHEERQGVGICMRCRTVICAACCTRIQGSNHCHSCLNSLAEPRKQPGRRPGSVVVALLLLGILWMVFLGILMLLQGRLAP